MRVDRESLRPEGAIHHDVGGLAPDAGKLDERVAVGGDFAAEVADEDFAQRDDILRLRIEQPDRLDMLLEALFAEIDHLLRRLHLLKKPPRRLVPDRKSTRLNSRHYCAYRMQ